MLQIVDKDYKRQKSYIQLHKLYKRATPSMWNNYVTALSMFDIIHDRGANHLLTNSTLNILTNERRGGPLFTRTNSRKIGFNCVTNRLQVVSNRLKIDWTSQSHTQFKIHCKKLFILEELEKL
jgi:hypothetical protein